MPSLFCRLSKIVWLISLISKIVPRLYQDCYKTWAIGYQTSAPRTPVSSKFVIQDAQPILSDNQDRMAYFTHIQDCSKTVPRLLQDLGDWVSNECTSNPGQFQICYPRCPAYFVGQPGSYHLFHSYPRLLQDLGDWASNEVYLQASHNFKNLQSTASLTTTMKIQFLALALLSTGANLVLSEESPSIRGRMMTEACGQCPPAACEQEECDKHDPFVCIKGNAIGGCNKHHDYWPLTSDCTKCCDLNTCPPPPPPTCERKCPDKVCELEQCDKHDPFVCFEGDAIGGCNKHPEFWLESNACTKCCDLNTCPPPPPPTCEQKCPDHVCKKEQCDEHDPFVCFEGHAIGGCNKHPKFWLETNACTKCCDISLCE